MVVVGEGVERCDKTVCELAWKRWGDWDIHRSGETKEVGTGQAVGISVATGILGALVVPPLGPSHATHQGDPRVYGVVVGVITVL